MQQERPRVTIIVPTKPGQAEIPSVEAARQLDYPHELIEVIVARGKQPAVQRNHALRAAGGDIIYFLDDDARPAPDALRRAVEHFRDPKVQMVGGPNLCPSRAPFLEQVFAVVLSSWIAFGPSRARYDRVGQSRPSGEKELILCNLLARRTAMLDAGGFDESLYPNEENALMDEVQKRGGVLLYDPDVVAERRPRATLRAFVKMLLNYGRGRAEQFRLHPTPGSALNFVPPLFVLFLALSPLWAALGWWKFGCWDTQAFGGPGGPVLTRMCEFRPAGLALAAYLAALGGQTLLNLPKGIFRALAAAPLLFATHFFYGLGFWRGLFTRVKQPDAAPVEVRLDRMTL